MRRRNLFPAAFGFFHRGSGVRDLPSPSRRSRIWINSSEFTPQDLATWQTDGVQHQLPRYDFEHTRINDRDAVLIWQYKNHAMQLTARIVSPDRIVEADCTPGSADEVLYLQACMRVCGQSRWRGRHRHNLHLREASRPSRVPCLRGTAIGGRNKQFLLLERAGLIHSMVFDDSPFGMRLPEGVQVHATFRIVVI